MICTKQPLTQVQSFSDRKFKLDRKQKLVAHWRKVDGKLICQWITA